LIVHGATVRPGGSSARDDTDEVDGARVVVADVAGADERLVAGRQHAVPVGVGRSVRKASLISSTVVARSRTTDRSVRDTSGTGTRTAMPTSRPASSGSTASIALAAPVFRRVMFRLAARPRRESSWMVSRISWSRVNAWMVVTSPPTTPKCSWSTFTIGARQFVVHDAADTMCIASAS